MTDSHGPYVIRLFFDDPEGMEETEAMAGPFADGTEVAAALLGAGFRCKSDNEDPTEVWWDGASTVQVIPLTAALP